MTWFHATANAVVVGGGAAWAGLASRASPVACRHGTVLLSAKASRGFSIRAGGDRIHLLGLDIKMFYGGPKEAIMHAIYRQNFGFTDIVIGRKHADAPYDDGKDIWDGLAAQRKFDELKGELAIKPVKVGFAAYYEELGRVGLVEECEPKGWKQVTIAGRLLRETEVTFADQGEEGKVLALHAVGQR